ncbi:hypothetical protein MCOR10_009094 [Pyricularia oryzae]|nr:hypothetical protein MCOR10_009094 [Pyricularia oryzae]
MASRRMSMYSVTSEGMGGPRGAGQQSTSVSTTTLLNAIHNIYLASQPYRLDAGTSLVVNTWLTATQAGPDGEVGGTVDPALAARAWEHARRRAEDGCIILGSLHQSTPSVMKPFLRSFPVSLPSSVFKALEAVDPFIHCVAPFNPSAPRHAALGVTLTMNLAGNVTAASIALSQAGIDTAAGLLSIPAEAGYRAFDVFYHLLSSASTPAEREFLGLKSASSYALLARSGTYDPPSYLPTADDGASADDLRAALKEIGIKGSSHRDFISTLAALLKLGDTLDYTVDEEVLEEVCEDVGGLLGVDPEVLAKQCTTEDRQTLVGGLYEALVDWVISKANQAIQAQLARIRDGDESSDGGRGARTPNSAEDNGDTVCLTILEVPDLALAKALAMRGIFDDSQGINSEMKQDGVEVASASQSVLRETQNAVVEAGPLLGDMSGPKGRDRQHHLEKREEVLEKVGIVADDDCFFKKLLFPVSGQGIQLGQAGRLDIQGVLGSSRAWYHLSIHPTDDSPASLAALPSINSAWSAGTVSRQLRAWRLPEWANRRNKNLDFTADFDVEEFVQRYSILGCREGRDGIETWILERGWSNGEVVVGHERVWMRESAWWEAENMLDMKPMGDMPMGASNLMAPPGVMAMDTGYSHNGSGYFPPINDAASNGSRDQLLHQRNQSQATLAMGMGHSPGVAPSVAPSGLRNVSKGDYGLGGKGDNHRDEILFNNEGEFVGALDPELANNKKIEEQQTSKSRRMWVALVWAITFWIPSPLLRYVGRMKRPDVRMAWREKFVLCFIIFLLNAAIVFWIIFLGRLLCPNFDKVWTRDEVKQHQGDTDFWVSNRGKVYDISKFWKIPHGDVGNEATQDLMQPFAGLSMDAYIPPPLFKACPGLGIGDRLALVPNATETENSAGMHISGPGQANPTSGLADANWYPDVFLPRMKEYYKGELVWDASKINSEGQNQDHKWVIYDNKVYDLRDYFSTLKTMNNLAQYKFLDDSLTQVVERNPGTDVTGTWNGLLSNAQRNNLTTYTTLRNNMNCMDNYFYVGTVDFRYTARCQTNNYFLLAFAIIMCAVILLKFVSALQFGSKRRPSPQDKFVICQVPAYTEGEDSLRKALDSLTALQYDNKRKLICVICDGVLTGEGNDRPTPKIVLDILGVDPKVDPPALPFKSVGASSEQLNYGKVYSGLYEFEGNVVPYVVVVKVGKESEQSKAKPGNRGKRDSQILLMSFLNRVHHRAPMNPLELEMFHQINNIIGVDPELYEYLLMIDADTCVREDALTRLVASCASDAKIAGICGETSLQNEERSWWTMIQVYEYFISHHLAKAFESLFGSVTCLPGCFTMYRLRTADKGKPLIISDNVIRDYSDCYVDTLHKKNLLSLGEDRYLTTLMTKHFPYMSFKFNPNAFCQTAAPEKWSVLLSQRRRWINSTIHNLVELMTLKEMCGFCCFSMRFVVFVDLFGTIILPATCVYLGYLIYTVASGTGPFPLITLIMLAAVYGLQALIFILKRQWQHIGWMIIYLLAFPIYSFILPIYSFWNQDNFSWGNTRIVVGESGKKTIVAVDDEGFDPRSIPLQRWDDYALANNLPGRRGGAGPTEKMDHVFADAYEMDDMRSVYSAARPGSVLTGMNRNTAYMSPNSPAPYQHMSRSPTAYAGPTPYSDNPAARQSMVSMSPYQDTNHGRMMSMSNLRNVANASPVPTRAGTAMGFAGGSRAPLGQSEAARQSTMSFDFQRNAAGPDDFQIVDAIRAVLMEVDLDTVTKKQVRALVEQRLQTELVGERRTFLDRQIDNELANM